MRLSASFPHLLTQLAVALVVAMLTVPVSAEPNPGTQPDTSAASQSQAPFETALPESEDAKPEAGASAAIDDTKPELGTGTATDDTQPEAGGTAATDGTTPEPGEAGAEAVVPEAPKSSVLIDIDKSTQEMTVFVDGIEQYRWPVSTGTRGYSTPSGTFTASSMNEMWYSRQWDNAPMPHAIFFTKKGHAIHGTTEEKRLGNAASHGCVRLSKANAKTLFHLVKETGLENTQVVLTGETKGGEGPKVASPGPRDYQAYPPPWFEGGPGFYAQPGKKQKRRGLFGRRWFQGETQGYYQPQPRYRRGY